MDALLLLHKDVVGMRIAGSQISLASRREYTEAYSLHERLRVSTRGSPPPQQGDRLELSDEARTRVAAPSATEASGDPKVRLSTEEQLKVLILRKLLGVVVRLAGELPAGPQEPAPELPPEAEAAPPPARQGEGWGLAYDRHETYRETESLSFSARGIIRTADGQEIRFDVQFAMSRSFFAEEHLSIRAGDATLVDPLVINYGGAVADLTARRYAFDLNADGTLEEIPFVAPGAGLLALDWNGDGKVSDGRELFGPATGDAFGELAAYDADGNGWLDEADPLWDRLKLWIKDAAGADHLVALSQVQVGAIFLGSLEAGFSYKDAQNRLQAQQQRAGLFVKEDGSVGAAQQIDLAL